MTAYRLCLINAHNDDHERCRDDEEADLCICHHLELIRK